MSELKEVYLDLTPNRPKTERTREDLGASSARGLRSDCRMRWSGFGTFLRWFCKSPVESM